jgi:5-methylcytosine-specific restriction enzyme A
MRDRFTHRTPIGGQRERIPPEIRAEVYRRDSFVCQYCGTRKEQSQLSVDHLIPRSRGGPDEITNYVSACRPCNQAKANLHPADFARRISIVLSDLPIHGDPIIDNPDLPIQFRLLRKRLIDQQRERPLNKVGQVELGGSSAQKRLEKEFRTAFWNTPAGKALEQEFPMLPGHARVMIPEITAIAKSRDDFHLLIELAKSASTRNLINRNLRNIDNLTDHFQKIAAQSDSAVAERIGNALRRFQRARGSATET